VASQDDVREALLDLILAQTKTPSNSAVTLKLAEAYAWIVNPNQSHGGSTEVSK